MDFFDETCVTLATSGQVHGVQPIEHFFQRARLRCISSVNL